MTRNCGNSFLKNIFVVLIQILGNSYLTKESVWHSMYLYNVWREQGM